MLYLSGVWKANEMQKCARLLFLIFVLHMHSMSTTMQKQTDSGYPGCSQAEDTVVMRNLRWY